MSRDIDVEELARWQKDARSFVLLDVREPAEVATASIAGATHIPMREIPARLGELDPHATIAVFCHHGGRSANVAAFLSARGFADVVNVDGGIDAYARSIDPAIPRY